MTLRATSLLALLTVALVAACHSDAPIPHTPTHLIVVSGSNQSGNLSTALDSSLVVEAVDGAGRPVSGVALTWTVIGGGTVSATSTTTDANGKSSVKWTLAPAAGTQVVTVTSSQITSASVSFVANNGAVLSGTVSSTGTTLFAPAFSRSARGTAHFSASVGTSAARYSPNQIVVAFKPDAIGIQSAASGAFRSMSVARSALAQMQPRVAALMQSRPLSNARISPAIAAARMTVDDPSQVESILQSLRSDPNVAWADRDQLITIRDGAPKATSADFVRHLASTGSGLVSNSAATRLPNDPLYWEGQWAQNMTDLPKAWALTTGSASVVVAVVDMGIRTDHPNIAANLTTDGYDFVSGQTFTVPQAICDSARTFTSTTGDGDGPDADPTDPDDIEFDATNNCWFHSSTGDHGLWTAGIIGAVGNKGLGFAGVNWTVKIRPVRVLDITGSGSFFDVAQGVLYAAGLPAPGAGGALVQTTRAAIINMSLGAPVPQGLNTALTAAVAAAENAGTLVVASAGNDGSNEAENTIPANLPGVMAIAAVGMDGNLATYSNTGSNISVSAPGGDFRLDENGGGGILGPGWDFTVNKPTYLFGYGTSASAPFVSGVAALLLAQNPSLTAAQIRSRIEQFASRPSGNSGRSDTFGWGILDAYNALTQTNGPARQAIVRLVDATSGAVRRTVNADASGNFAFANVATGVYYVQAGEDEAGDGVIGLPGRRFAMAGGFGTPTAFNMNGNAASTALLLGLPAEVEPNDDIAHANVLDVGGYVVGSITGTDVADFYVVTIPAAGVYTFETSGLVGTCGLGVELDTFLSVTSSAGAVVGSNDDTNITTGPGPFCSRVQVTLTPGIYYAAVSASPLSAPGVSANHGRYRLQVRAGN